VPPRWSEGGQGLVQATLSGGRATTSYTRRILSERGIPRKTFIRLAAVLGLSPAAATALNSSCAEGGGGGGDAGKSTSSPTTTSSSTTTEQAQEEEKTQEATTESTQSTNSSDGVGEGEPIAKVDEVPLNSSKRFTKSGSKHPYVLVHLKDGRFVAYSAVCTHEGCWVDYQPETQMLACPCHGSVFDPAKKGAVVEGPAIVPLPNNVGLKVTGKEVKLA
jgi:Rieske Fe-S protein